MCSNIVISVVIFLGAISESDQSSYDEDENDEVIQEIYGTDISETPNG